ncbi:hypothetical protein SKAU_G00283990 [Synaphobranchus kaupii]|uniref:Uncharacterized protein n=1 Tax=Synaphobranchus kaupii TaxID=118154 RepID=A0A9Q1EXK8_SYNKA|nr:hypothetical protein SKAU_G00283990 [Synaphobranchus kaupii]
MSGKLFAQLISIIPEYLQRMLLSEVLIEPSVRALSEHSSMGNFRFPLYLELFSAIISRRSVLFSTRWTSPICLGSSAAAQEHRTTGHPSAWDLVTPGHPRGQGGRRRAAQLRRGQCPEYGDTTPVRGTTRF